MGPMPHPSSPRTMARSLCGQLKGFLEPRITNAVESAADELEAHVSIEESRDGADTADAEQEIAAIRALGRRAGKTFCEGLGEDVERALVFGQETARAPEQPNKRRSLAGDGFEVSLLADDELDLSVLISTAASRFERRNREALERAVAPIAQTFGEDEAESLRGLIGVFPLINRYSKLVAGVALSVPTRARLMNAFQFHVLEELAELYQPLARNVEAVPARRASKPVAARDSESPTESQTGPHTEPRNLSGWVQLLNQARGPAAGASSCSAGGSRHSAGFDAGAGAPSTVAGGRAVSHDELVSAVAALPAAVMGAGTVGGADDHSLYDHVITGLQQRGGLSPSQMPAMDLDVLRLVSMFFETFLGNETLPTALRFLVGRLQLPVLRLALADGSFFDDRDHPARQLIEALCRIGVGWSSDLERVERSPGFKEASALVDEIVDWSEPTAGLFEEAVARLEAVHADRAQKADRVEGRVVELEVGRAKLRAAKLVVQDALNERLARHRCLATLHSFFADTWSKVLTFVCLRYGCEADEWSTALSLCDELAEVLTPAASKEESKQRFARVPNLLERMESRMLEAGLPSGDVDQSMEQLFDHIDTLRENEDAWFATAGDVVVEQEDEVISITLIPVTPTDGGESRPLPAWAAPGSWVRVNDPEQPERYQQVKIAANVADTHEILLVDERGARWGVWSESEFATAVADGRVTPVPHEDVVQQTLDAMIAQLTRPS